MAHTYPGTGKRARHPRFPGLRPPAAHAGRAALAVHAGPRTRLAGQARAAAGLDPAATAASTQALGALAATVPVTVQVPAGNVAYLEAHAAGVQIYTCNASGGGAAWSSSVPAATLFNAAGQPIATRFAGPTWQANDSSTVKGNKLASDTVTPDSIPWLLLSAASTTVGPTGGAIYNYGGVIRLRSTIVAGSYGVNCIGVSGDGGYNLDSDGSCGLSQPTDISNTNPLLGPLANNGGPTPTMALPANSPAIDHGPTRAQGCPAADQRGYARPDPADGVQGQCDIGAFESGAVVAY
jgi:hypothetical protein